MYNCTYSIIQTKCSLETDERKYKRKRKCQNKYCVNGNIKKGTFKTCARKSKCKKQCQINVKNKKGNILISKKGKRQCQKREKKI